MSFFDSDDTVDTLLHVQKMRVKDQLRRSVNAYHDWIDNPNHRVNFLPDAAPYFERQMWVHLFCWVYATDCVMALECGIPQVDGRYQWVDSDGVQVIKMAHQVIPDDILQFIEAKDRGNNENRAESRARVLRGPIIIGD